MLPESTLRPVREMAGKYRSSPLISIAMKERSLSNPADVKPCIPHVQSAFTLSIA
jgi:hypothetical protein